MVGSGGIRRYSHSANRNQDTFLTSNRYFRILMDKRIIFTILIIINILSLSKVHAELLLFGGSGHDDFLGCYNCSKDESASICNKYGKFGSKYSSDSIWNKYGTYGSKYNSSSPWNQYSSGNDVPVIVDRNGNFYGYFTINNYRSNAFESSAKFKRTFKQLNGDLDKFREIFCG